MKMTQMNVVRRRHKANIETEQEGFSPTASRAIASEAACQGLLPLNQYTFMNLLGVNFLAWRTT
jgi:hypothetical protein